jgi:hypothetical protein
MKTWNRGIRIVALLGLVGALAAVQLLLREPESTALWEALFDSGHAPLYGVFSLLVLALLDAIRPSWRRGRRYIEAFAVSSAAGAVMEALQYLGPREPQVADLLRNLAGSGAFLSIAASFDRDLFLGASRRRTATRLGLWTGAAGALCFAFVPVILAGGAILARNNAFPWLCGFDTVWERQHVGVNENATVEFTRPPKSWRPHSEGFAAYVIFLPGRYSLLTRLGDTHYSPCPIRTRTGPGMTLSSSRCTRSSRKRSH